jgi:glycosyltransferase involved in cell wall biosynthesis
VTLQDRDPDPARPRVETHTGRKRGSRADPGSEKRVTSAIPIDHRHRAVRSLAVTIIAANPFEFDSRFLRSAKSLAEDGHRLTILAWSGDGLPAEELIAPGIRLERLDVDRRLSSGLRPLPAGLRNAICRLLGIDPDSSVLSPDAPRGLDRVRHPVRRLVEIVANARRVGPWTDLAVTAARGSDVFHCQSLIALPVARGAARRCGGRFVYDVADYHTESERLAHLPWVLRELLRRRERRWARDASGFLAVSDPVADLVARRWNVARPALLLNCPDPWRPEDDAAPVSDRLREAAGIARGRPIVLYQGGFSVDRGIEELLAAVDDPSIRALDVATVFLGYGRLLDYLEGVSRAKPGRVHVLPAVPPAELPEWTSGADVAFVGQPGRTLNFRMNLPNKLFESLMAGVPVIVSEGNEQCRLVTAESVGRCAVMEPGPIAQAIGALLAQDPSERAELRAHCRRVALARYTWDKNAGGLVELYRRLATDPR